MEALGGEWHADEAQVGPETALSSPQREVLLKDDLAGQILLFVASHSDFRALVRACVRPAARRDFRTAYIALLTGEKVADMVDSILLATSNEVSPERSEPCVPEGTLHADGGPSVSCVNHWLWHSG